MSQYFLAVALVAATALSASGQQTPAESSHAAAAAELVAVLQLEKQQGPDLAGLMAGMSPDNPMAVRMAEVMKEFWQEFMPWEKLEPEFVHVYQSAFTEAELRQLIAFYRTPIGQRLIEKTPEITQSAVLATQKLLAPHMPELQRRLMARMGGGGGPDR